MLRCVCVAGLIVVGYSTLVGNGLDYRENNRFRVETAPVVLVLGALGAELAAQRLSRWGRDRSGAIRAPAEPQRDR